MKKTLQITVIILAIVGILALVAFKLSVNKKEVEAKVYHPDANLAAVIQAVTVREGPFSQTTRFLGSFEPNREVTLASETTGKIISVGVQEGSQVVRGSLVAKLDDGVLQAQLHSDIASLENAASTLKRYEQAPNGVTQLQLDNARTQLLTSQAQIEQLKKQISQFTITAPFAGVVTSRNFDLGAVVSPGSPLATLSDISFLKLELSVPETYISQFRTGMPLPVNTDVYPGSEFKGRVHVIATKSDASHNYTIKVLVPNNAQKPLRAGMYGNVLIGHTTGRQAMSIPRSALVGSTQKPQVYVVAGGVAKLRDITIGEGNSTSVVIVHGLHPGEVIASGGLVNLSDGARVSIK